MRHISLTILASIFIAALISSDTTLAENEVEEVYWNQFRGPNGDGKSVATDLPLEFNETQNIRWSIPIHDKGWSSPVVWGDQIWLTTGREDGTELFAICVDKNSGKIMHDINVFDVAHPQLEYNDLNSHATPPLL